MCFPPYVTLYDETKARRSAAATSRRPTKVGVINTAKTWLCFSRKSLALAKHCLSSIFITNLFWRESVTMQGAKNIDKILLLLSQFSIYLNKKQIYDSARTRKENASKYWNCIILMFLTSCIVYFVFGYACRGRTRGAQFPGRRITIGAPKSLNNVTNILSSTQYICFWKTSGSNMGRQTCFLPREPSNLITPLYACFMWICL